MTTRGAGVDGDEGDPDPCDDAKPWAYPSQELAELKLGGDHELVLSVLSVIGSSANTLSLLWLGARSSSPPSSIAAASCARRANGARAWA